MTDLEVSGGPDRWTALRGQAPCGSLTTLELPDRRCVLGFTAARRERLVTIPVSTATAALAGVGVPDGFTIVDADAVDPTALRLLDDELRQDVPGAAGWRWDAEGFAEETYRSPQYDPATYAVAVHRATGRHAGPVATVREHRRIGLARALLARVFGEVHRRGADGVAAEIDETNVASLTLLGALGARRVGGSVELVRHPTGSGRS